MSDKPFTVEILWGEKSTRRENPRPTVHAYATEAELKAFLEGVDEASGWMDYEIVQRCAICNSRIYFNDEPIEGAKEGEHCTECGKTVCCDCYSGEHESCKHCCPNEEE